MSFSHRINSSDARRFRWAGLLGLVVIAGLWLSACNRPTTPVPTGDGAGYIYTAAAQTVSVRLTEQAGTPLVPATETPEPPTPTSGVQEPTPSGPTETSAPADTSTPEVSSCDMARFVRDVTYPDGSTLTPGQAFNKTWRLRNSGTCPWTTGYAIFFFGGDAMGAPASVAIPKDVAPGDTVDVTVAMVAPSTPGEYRGEWKLRNASGQVFGLGEEAKPFWIEINVAEKRGTMLDFYLQADNATWYSGVGSPNTALTFGGPNDSTAGAANVMENAPLETGAPGEMVLLTIPRHETDGVVAGVFSAYTISSGDHFKGTIGLLIPTGECGSGSVTFQIGYREGGSSTVVIKEFTKDCTGQLTNVDVDLSAYSGKTVQFVLAVSARGPFGEDWAFWDKPRIER